MTEQTEEKQTELTPHDHINALPNRYELARNDDGNWMIAVPRFCPNPEVSGAAALKDGTLYLERGGKLMICSNLSARILESFTKDKPQQIVVAEMATEETQPIYSVLPIKFA